MKKIMCTSLLCLLMASTPVFAHHPAADIVDEEIYAMIDEAVSLTPHADMVFDDMGSMVSAMTSDVYRITQIYIDSVGTGTNMIMAIILNYASKLSGEVSIVIEYEDVEGAGESSLQETEDSSGSANSWSEWGRPLLLTITQVVL